MTRFPKYLTQYPNADSKFPLHLSIHKLHNGYEAHRHDYLEFSYVISGSGTEYVNGIPHPMIPGTFNFVLPYQIHEIHTDPGSILRLYNCNFGLSIVLDTFAAFGLKGMLMGEREHVSHVLLESGDRAWMEAHLEEMLREYQSVDPFRHVLLKVKLTEALVRFFRRRKAPSGAGSAGSGHSVIWEVVQYVHSRYEEDLSLSRLAVQFGLSVSHLSELFKKHTGQNFVPFLHELRTRHACGLLLSTDMNVSDVAMEVGYGSYKTFSRVFREHRGTTPQMYRRSLRQEGLKPMKQDFVASLKK